MVALMNNSANARNAALEVAKNDDRITNAVLALMAMGAFGAAVMGFKPDTLSM